MVREVDRSMSRFRSGQGMGEGSKDYGQGDRGAGESENLRQSVISGTWLDLVTRALLFHILMPSVSCC